MTFYAHTLEGKPPEEWQELEAHLQETSAKAAVFASCFDAGKWGKIAGQLHDIGKYHPEFQTKLLTNSNKYVDHKGVGARLSNELSTPFGRILAYCIGGHHGGLPNGCGNDFGTSLEELCRKADPLPGFVPNPLPELTAPGLPFTAQSTFQCAFFTRMLYSALVDADFLDTEKFMDPERSSWRPPGPSLDALAAALDARLNEFNGKGRINKLRTEILKHCRSRAHLNPGLFTLTVPTGGGKTLTSMAFALDHARRHGLRRIVYVIPYTSIIEQNAAVFRSIFPEGAVLEHHSTFDEGNLSRAAREREKSGDETPQMKRHRLSCENWDAPIVVTTNVQFFESLFAAKPSKCRKLHNLAESVIILDEAQMLPVKYLDPCLRALEELACNYKASIVLCTATQPALDAKDFEPGLKHLRELAPDPIRMHQEFARTRLVHEGERSLEDVADMIRERKQVLCIVNTRKRASELFGLVQDEPGSRHLSALMCPAHRSLVLDEIRQTLKAGTPCRVVSTQLVEAGVDVSFPEVIRELAGLDSITQAAGRCNREGELPGLADVTVFKPKEGVVRAFQQAAGSTESTLRAHPDDPFSPEAVRTFFQMTYWLSKDRLDEKKILKRFQDPKGLWDFRRADHDFRLIENDMVPVIIPYDDDAEKLVQGLRYADFTGGILRKLQQYTVQVYAGQFAALREAGAIELISERYAVLIHSEFYDPKFGLTFPDSAPNPSDLII